MPTVTIHDAKTNLSKLLRRVEAGEEIIIARGSTPVAILKDYKAEELGARRLAGMGSLIGKMDTVPDSALFDPLPDDELEQWNNPKIEP